MPKLDDRIREIGGEIFARVRKLGAAPSPLARIDDAFMDLAMRDEVVKSQLFRFVDVLPTLNTSAAVSGHLREYLEPIADRLPGPLRMALRDGILSPVVAAAANFNVRRMARKFIASPDLDHTVKAIGRLRDRRLAFTVDLLGEAVISENEADAYQRRYLDLARELPRRLAASDEDRLIDRDATGPIPRANISLKLSALYSQFDALNPSGTMEAVLGRLRPVLRVARQNGAFVNLDMEQFSFKELTIQIFKSILMDEEFRDWADVGIAMQAYLRGTLEDLKSLSKWAERRGTSVTVRLVKGAYWDFETVIAAQNGWDVPVFIDKAETDANFEACAEFLIEHRRMLRPAIASHNIRSIAAALASAERFGADAGDVEFQMLFGMAEPIKAALIEMNQRVRVYAPVGELLPGMAYLVRRLLENTSNESFLRAGFVEHEPEEQLLMNPVLHMRPSISAAKVNAAFANAPPTDFSREANRRAMSRAVEEFAKKPCADYPLIIGGERITTGQWIESLNPSHKSRVVGRAACARTEDADRAVAAAKAAFASWPDVSGHERAALLDRVAEILQRDRFDLAAIEVAECGKPWRDADADIAEAIDFCRYYAWQMRELSSPKGVELPGETNRWVYESRGPAVVIAPWNFPLAILTGMAAAAVVAGNPVILKPAEQSPVIAWHLALAFEEAGTPVGVVNYLPGIGEEIGPLLISHPDVALIAFTGSRAVGLSINRAAAEPRDGQDHVKRVIVEMGGKNAIIVDEDADLDEAIVGIVASAFGYSGQKCSACSRVVTLAGVYDALLARLTQAVGSLKIAPAEDPACGVGPVIDADALARIRAAIDRGKQDARLVFAGDAGSLAGEGYFVGPLVFAEVPAHSALATDEIFGPVLAVMKAEDLDHALAIANGVQYALTGGIYSRSPANIERARREFRVGNLYINRKITGALVGRQPFGGFKLSGGGTQAGGADYLRHFLMPRCITENTLRHGFAGESDTHQ